MWLRRPLRQIYRFPHSQMYGFLASSSTEKNVFSFGPLTWWVNDDWRPAELSQNTENWKFNSRVWAARLWAVSVSLYWNFLSHWSHSNRYSEMNSSGILFTLLLIIWKQPHLCAFSCVFQDHSKCRISLGIHRTSEDVALPLPLHAIILKFNLI